jgi:hypothetical protein
MASHSFARLCLAVTILMFRIPLLSYLVVCELCSCHNIGTLTQTVNICSEIWWFGLAKNVYFKAFNCIEYQALRIINICFINWHWGRFAGTRFDSIRKIPWSESTSEQYRPSDRGLSAKLVPQHDRSFLDPSDRSRYFFFSSSSSIVLTRLSGTTCSYLERKVAPPV